MLPARKAERLGMLAKCLDAFKTIIIVDEDIDDVFNDVERNRVFGHDSGS